MNERRNLVLIKYIFVIGGVVSGLGKGIVAASLGRLLKSRGLKVAAQKLDPYINVDPGTMSPYQHGEVFVTDDGAETDLDLGHYERFIDENLNKYSNLTSGKVYWNVLNKERNGEYLGQTIQVIPHITNEIKHFIYEVGNKTNADVVITEIGGTTGDIESQPFLEAIRQVGNEIGKDNSLYIHVTLVPYLQSSQEHKTKPTQHSVKELRGMGISPDIIILRSDRPIDEDVSKKISMFCNVTPDCVIENITLPVLYEVPLMLEKNNFSSIVCRKLNINTREINIDEWQNMIFKIQSVQKKVNIAIVGKYVQLHDAYLSVAEALRHAGYELGTEINIKWIDSEPVNDKNVEKILSDCNCDGILIPGGFGIRGIDGKISAAKYARENNIPYLGICLGMQIAVIEFVRNVCNIKDADSGEFNDGSENKVIDYLPDQSGNIPKGGTLRLGAYPCKIMNGSKLFDCYKTNLIYERHRHRYEFNNKYKKTLTDNGMTISGVSPDENIVEVVELKNHKFFIGVQYHPEFKSRPNKPHPLFVEFIRACINEWE
jgi:CTP synthase